LVIKADKIVITLTHGVITIGAVGGYSYVTTGKQKTYGEKIQSVHLQNFYCKGLAWKLLMPGQLVNLPFRLPTSIVL
jgi:hypothetical protein